MIPFNLAYPVKNKDIIRNFYHNVTGCTQGRKANIWIDLIATSRDADVAGALDMD